METLSTTDARRDFADLLNRVGYGGETFLLERRGKTLAGLIPGSALTSLENFEEWVAVMRTMLIIEEGNRDDSWTDLEDMAKEISPTEQALTP